MEIVVSIGSVVLARRTVVFDLNKHYLDHNNTISPEEWFAYKSNTIKEYVDDLKIELAAKFDIKRGVSIYMIAQSKMNDEDFECVE